MASMKDTCMLGILSRFSLFIRSCSRQRHSLKVVKSDAALDMALLFGQCDVMHRKWTYNRFNVQLFSFLVPLLKEFCGNELGYLQMQVNKSVRQKTHRTSGRGETFTFVLILLLFFLAFHLQHWHSSLSFSLWSSPSSLIYNHSMSTHCLYKQFDTLCTKASLDTHSHVTQAIYQKCLTKIYTGLVQHINHFRGHFFATPPNFISV